MLSNALMNRIGYEPYLQSRNDPYFNFPETEDIVGEGVKKMKGYISNISLEELQKKRESFWGTRVEGNKQTWNFLKEICEMRDASSDDIEAMLAAYEIRPYRNCINVTYDSSGALYEIPNYCIHDPKVYDLPENHKVKPKEKEITFICRKGIDQAKIKKTNYSLVLDIKTILSKKYKTTKEKIRLFFGGKELKNEKELWFYNLDDDCVVSFMIS